MCVINSALKFYLVKAPSFCLWRTKRKKRNTDTFWIKSRNIPRSFGNVLRLVSYMLALLGWVTCHS